MFIAPCFKFKKVIYMVFRSPDLHYYSLEFINNSCIEYMFYCLTTWWCKSSGLVFKFLNLYYDFIWSLDWFEYYYILEKGLDAWYDISWLVYVPQVDRVIQSHKGLCFKYLNIFIISDK